MSVLHGEIALGGVRILLRRNPQGFYFSPKSPREYDTIVYVRRGRLRITAASSEILAGEGETVFIPRGVQNTTHFEGEDNEIFNFFFNITSSRISSEMIFFPAAAQVIAQMEEVIRAYSEKGVMNRNYYTGALYQLIYLVQEGAGGGKYQRILPAIRYIEQNYAENRSIADYARMVMMSESGFRREFTQCTGKSPVAYRNELRLRRAEEAILGGATVSEAALAAGFCSASFYCRMKKKRQ